MKKILITFALLIVSSVTVSANELKETRKHIGEDLNHTVGILKKEFYLVDRSLETEKNEINTLHKSAESLKNKSKELESNPTVLSHGRDKVENCRDKKELNWDGKKWICQQPLYKSDCLAASDEYKYEEPSNSGNYKCSKSPKGQSIKYKWEFRANSNECFSNTYKRKVYRCYYVNKRGQQIDVEEKYCGKSTDLTGSNGPRCMAKWQAGSWGGCNKTCGGGTQTRSVTCKANHFCPDAKPAASQACNTHGCGRWIAPTCRSCSNSGFHDRYYSMSYYCSVPGGCSGTAPTKRCKCSREKHGSDRKR
tara:strand:- start:1339 stop:2259 length:921 start_codon:yes stop_codon:yes gene_type:complete